MVPQIIVLLAIAATVSSKLFTEESSQQKTMWQMFKKEFHKDYNTTAEENQRFDIFVENLKLVDERNDAEKKAGGSAVHGVTKFSDISEAEFKARYLTADVKMKSKKNRNVLKSVPPPKEGDGSYVNWAGVLTTPVNDQGYCGSCWAWSAAEQVESDSIRTLGESTSFTLSPEQIVECDKGSYGCNGGWTESAYDYINSTGGLESEADYPYSEETYFGVTGSCKSNASDYVVSVSSYTTIDGETNMANYMLSTGPLSVCLDASTWSSYTGGIMSAAACGDDVDHCVQAVGVNTSTTDGYWIVRNSWGTSWGEDGYIYLAYGQNTCDITNDPTYTDVFLV